MLDFPNSPSVNQTYTSGGKTWRWDGVKWNAEQSIGISDVTNLQSSLDGLQSNIDGKANTSHEHSASAITSGTLGVARGGTGAATLTTNAVVLGNGTSAVQTVAPGTSGNVLTSNGTTWQSTAPSGGGLTTAGDGLSASGSTVSINTNNSLGVGSLILGKPSNSVNDSATVAGSDLQVLVLFAIDGTPEPLFFVTGTWRNVSGGAISNSRCGLFIRIS